MLRPIKMGSRVSGYGVSAWVVGAKKIIVDYEPWKKLL
jgi:hypothetical protein